MPATIADFVKAAEDSGILTAGSLEDFLRGVEPGSDASPLAERLVAAGKLTSFQASSLCDGGASSLVLGPYVVLDLLGRGGMGVVYKAEHRTMRRIVALKVIAPTVLQSPAAVRRFAREVQATARLDHPNIVTAFDAGEVAGLHYLVMQYVDGRNLAELVRESGPQPVEHAVEWVVQAARGLAFAHEQGVIHRDIKPGNLLVDSRGTVKILDMGLAAFGSLDAERDPLTATGQIMGTVDYMAPEQAMDTRHADARSDIYSLGVTLWYLLTGRILFAGETAVNRMMAHIHDPPPTLGSVCGPLPPGLDAVFQRMVAKNPLDRFQSMRDVIASLEPLVQDRGCEDLPRRMTGSRTSRLAFAGAVSVLFVAVLYGFGITRERPGESVDGTGATMSAVAARPGDEPIAPSSTRPSPAVAPFDATLARGHQEAWAGHLGIDIETTNSIGQTLVVIPPGTFTMGEGPGTVDVTLTEPFLLGQTEVTQGQWREVMKTEPWKGQQYTIEGLHVPATFVSWNDAVAFCRALTERERDGGRIGGEQRYRLPTDAEWEFACRAGTTTPFSFGVDARLLAAHGWFGGGWMVVPIAGGNTSSEMYAHPVGVKRPNPFGLFDVHGNAWEWVADWYADLPRTPVTDPEGPREAAGRVLRSGSWDFNAVDCRSSVRIGNDPSHRDYHRSFRIALSPPGAMPTEATQPPIAPVMSRSKPPVPANAPFDAAEARRHQAAWAGHLGIDVETTNSIGQTLVVIPPGTFTMGEGSSTVDVTLAEPFLLGQTEVTQGQWREVMGTEPCRGKRYVIDHDDAAVTYVTWHDAVTFCETLTARERASGALDTTKRYRLPTGAEWEWACRAGTISTFSFGDDAIVLGAHAWYGNDWDAAAELPIPGGNTASQQYAHEVRLKQPNAWRLFDMHGNVFEWIDGAGRPPVMDAFATRSSTLAESEACRGGSWLLGPLQCRSAFQKQHKAADVSGDLGFRIAMTLEGADDAASGTSSRSQEP